MTARHRVAARARMARHVASAWMSGRADWKADAQLFHRYGLIDDDELAAYQAQIDQAAATDLPPSPPEELEQRARDHLAGLHPDERVRAGHILHSLGVLSTDDWLALISDRPIEETRSRPVALDDETDEHVRHVIAGPWRVDDDLLIVAVQLYGHSVGLRWRSSSPTPEEVDELQRLDPEHWLPELTSRRRDVELTDDLGTRYELAGGGGSMRDGEHRFRPGLRRSASRLEIRRGDAQVSVKLPVG